MLESEEGGESEGGDAVGDEEKDEPDALDESELVRIRDEPDECCSEEGIPWASERFI